MQIDYANYFWQNDKVRLRKATADDWEAFYANCFDSQARFFLDNLIELPRDAQNAKELWINFIEKASTDKNFAFAIETLDGTYVGSAFLNSINERNGTFGIGLVMEKACRGQGLGTAAMRILLNYAFNERRLNKYNGFVVEGNLASEHMLKKLGMTHEGVRRETIFHKGEYLNEIHYGITAKEFNAIKDCVNNGRN